MSSIANKSNETARGPLSFEKKVKVPMRLSAVHAPAEMPLHDDSKVIPGAVVVAITCGSNHTQVVYHHPVGITSLPESGWVFTPIHEVKTLLANSVDPSAARKAKAVQDFKTDCAVKEGHYVKDVDGTLRLPPAILGGATIASIRAQARLEFEKEKQLARQAYLAECAQKGTKPKQDWHFGVALEHYLPEVFKAYEAAFTKKWKASFSKEIDKIVGPPFATLGGPNGDRPQRLIQCEKDYTQEQMVDAVRRTLLHTSNGDQRFDVDVRKSEAAFKEAGDDPAKLKEFIFAHCFPVFRPNKA